MRSSKMNNQSFDHDMSFVFSEDIERWMKGGVRFFGRERAKKSHRKRKELESINKTVEV